MVKQDTSKSDSFLTGAVEDLSSKRIPIGSYFSNIYDEILAQLVSAEKQLVNHKVILKSDWNCLRCELEEIQYQEINMLLPFAFNYLGHEADEISKTLNTEHQQISIWLQELSVNFEPSIQLNRCRQLSRFIDCYQKKMQIGLYQIVDDLGFEVT